MREGAPKREDTNPKNSKFDFNKFEFKMPEAYNP
jgi:hypothetical protein